jgi:hypothetical protein
MTISVAELADLPTAPTISKGLREAAAYADHAIAEGVALIVIGGLIDPEVTDHGWPDATWDAGHFSQRVGHAHQVISGWAASHSEKQLAHLFEAAADRARQMETATR